MDERTLTVLSGLALLICWIGAVYFENSDKGVSRRAFAGSLAGSFLLTAVPDYLPFDPTDIADQLSYNAVLCAYALMFAKITTRRSRAIGWGKDAAYLMLLPVLNLYLIFTLLRKRPPTPRAMYKVWK